jgi:large subunit ribosomal protein L5
MARLKEHYEKQAKPVLVEKFNYKNPMQVPRMIKIVISMGLGEASKDKNAMQDCRNELAILSGQRAIDTRAKKAIANFKLRMGQLIGLKVTLRKKRMYDFMERFCNIIAPRIRDFRGFARKCDGRGSYSLGVEEQGVFPEIHLDAVKRTQGMNITFVTNAQTDEECVELLSLMGFPYKT